MPNYRKDDFAMLVDGVEILDLAEGFGITPKFADKDGYVETTQGEVGFNIAKSTAAEAAISIKQVSPSKAYLDGIALERREVSVAMQLKDPLRRPVYGFERMGMMNALIKPAEEKVGNEAATLEYRAMGYNYFKN